MSTYTASLGLEEITPGDQAGLWGNTTNNNLVLIDQAITGVTPISFAGLSGTTRTLTDFNGAQDEARAAVLNITGSATGANNVVVPNKQKTYLVRNNTGQDVVFATASPSATFTVGAGNSILIFCDGNNNVFTGIASPSVGTLGVAAGGTGSTTFTAGFVKSTGGTNALTSASSVALGSDVSGILPVTSGGTGLSSITSGALLQGNGTGNISPLVGGSPGQVATWNGSQWIAATPTAGTVTSVNGQTGAVSITTSSIGAYPASNPSGYVTSSALTGYATLSGTNNFTGQSNYSTSGGITCNASAVGSQAVSVNAGGYISGMSPVGVQIGVSGWGFNASSLSGGVSVVQGGTFATDFRGTGNFQSNNSPNWATTSDINIKTNIRPITSALDKLNSLKPTHFEYKDKIGETQTGFIAQEFEIVFPGHTLKTTVEEKYKEFLPKGVTELMAIDMNLTAYLVKAIQELSVKVTELEEQVINLGTK